MKTISILTTLTLICAPVYAANKNVQTATPQNTVAAGALAGQAASRNQQASSAGTLTRSTTALPPDRNQQVTSGVTNRDGRVTPDVPFQACSIFEEFKNEGQQMRAVDRPGGRQMCPAGYSCQGRPTPGQCLVHCTFNGETRMAASSPSCRWNDCALACAD